MSGALWYGPLLPGAAQQLAGGSGAYTLACDAGSYTLTGVAATLTKTSILTADAGSYSLTGQDASLLLGRVLTADAGSYALTGADADLTYTQTSSAPKGRKRVVRWRPWNPWKTEEKPFVIEDGAIKPVPAPPIAVEPITVDLAPIYERHDALTRRYLKALQEQEEELIAVLLIADDD